MRYANIGKDKIEAAPNVMFATCPCCEEDVIPKCGNIKQWHFAHKSKSDCSYKPMTAWHYDWQNNFEKKFLEVVQTNPITKEKHIADVKNSDNVVIEFQHSNIKNEEIKSRESFYKKMIWVLDSNTFKVETKQDIKIKISSINDFYIKKNFDFYIDWFKSKGINNEHELKNAIKKSKYFIDRQLLYVSQKILEFNAAVFIDNNDGTLWFIPKQESEYYIKEFNHHKHIAIENDFLFIDEKNPQHKTRGVLFYNPGILVDNFGRYRFATLLTKEDFIKKYNK